MGLPFVLPFILNQFTPRRVLLEPLLLWLPFVLPSLLNQFTPPTGPPGASTPMASLCPSLSIEPSHPPDGSSWCLYSCGFPLSFPLYRTNSPPWLLSLLLFSPLY